MLKLISARREFTSCCSFLARLRVIGPWFIFYWCVVFIHLCNCPVSGGVRINEQSEIFLDLDRVMRSVMSPMILGGGWSTCTCFGSCRLGMTSPSTSASTWSC
jgi:hypothetical protein